MEHNQAPRMHILLPLDGSDMSEFALPYATTVATALNAGIVVARVIVRTSWHSASSGYMLAPHIYTDLMEQEKQDAHAQTKRVVTRVGGQGAQARALVEIADSPMALAEVAARERVSLVVMATHGRGGMARMALGSVADDLVRHGHWPTLLTRAQGLLPEQPALSHALVPLDGSTFSEASIPVVALLAGSLVTQITLLRVIDTEEHNGAADEARHALESTRQRIEWEMPALRGHVNAVLRWGGAAEQILEASGGYHLIVMATHGETGATRWAFGSVADAVLHEARTPLLLARPPQHHD